MNHTSQNNEPIEQGLIQNQNNEPIEQGLIQNQNINNINANTETSNNDALENQSNNQVNIMNNTPNTPPPVSPANVSYAKTTQTQNPNRKVKKKKKHIFLKLLLVIIIIFVIIKGINAYKRTLDKIYITNSEIYKTKDNSHFYKIENKINKISSKVKTTKKVTNTQIKLYSYNLTLYEKEYSKDKKWTIENVTLPMGTSTLEIKVTLENGEIIERNITLYNTSPDNLGNLDTKDNDLDQLLNYQEDMYGTNKSKSDSDNDGLSDYEELNYTNTNPLKYATYNDNYNDADLDYDLDGLTNIEELQKKTNPIINDSDGDGLSDGDEIKKYNTNPLIYDTDNDGASDYAEVINFNSNPNEKTNNFSGKVESANKEVGITLKDISLDDIENTQFEQSGISILNENIEGYIMPAYDISTSKNIGTSEISFNFANYDVDKNSNPTIYYFNETTNKLEELPTKVVGTIATATVSHFSTYILIDKNKLESINQVDSNSSDIEVIEPINGEFLIIYSPTASLVANVPIYIITNPDITEKQSEILKEKFNILFENQYEINIINIKSDYGFNILKDLFDMIYKALYDFVVPEDEQEFDFLFSTSNLSNKSYVNSVFGAFALGYLNNIDDLGAYFLEEGKDNIFKDNYILIDLDDPTDTNNDGISDAFTKAIISGAITTETGLNPFEGYTLEQIHKNDDLDEDELKNGEEILIKTKNGKYYLQMTSNPTLIDSDSDGLEDTQDASPLISVTPGFAIGGSLNDDINTDWLEKAVDSYNSLYNQGSIVMTDGKIYVKYEQDGEIKYSPDGFMDIKGEVVNVALTGVAIIGNIGGEHLNVGDAGKAWTRYYEKSAQTYTEEDLVEPTFTTTGEINDKSIFGSGDVQGYLKKNSNKIIQISEENIKDGDTRVIKTINTLIGTSQKDGFDQNENVFGFLHSSSSQAIAEVTNKNGEYTMKLRYFILDIYDWKNSEECDINNNSGLNKCVTEVHYYNQMLLGNAKAFYVKIEYDIELTWKKGETPKMKVLEGTPYA